MDSPRVVVKGPLAPFRDGFWKGLLAKGYTPLSGRNQLRLMAHVSRWLDAHGLRPRDLTSDRVKRFLQHRRKSGYTHWLSSRGMTPILEYLSGAGALPCAVPPSAAATPVEVLLGQYEGYLTQERSLGSATVPGYLRAARDFLSTLSRRAGATLRDLSPGDVTSFIVARARSVSIGYAKLKVTGLRSFLRYLHVQGELSRDLANAVPAVAGWRLAGLPKALSPDELRRLLKSCDRRRSIGRRDFAAILLMARLGLRAGEVASLRLEDLDWTHGELVVRGKPRREDRLPLPRDVGRALSDYLKRGRPRREDRHVFVRARAPHGPLGRPGVTALVQLASQRAELSAVTAHRLRHTAATQMLRTGASLPEIAHVLRHRHMDTTSIYAKVDRSRLQTLARAWPGDAQ